MISANDEASLSEIASILNQVASLTEAALMSEAASEDMLNETCSRQSKQGSLKVVSIRHPQ